MEGGLHMIPSVKLTSAGAALLAKTPAGFAVPVNRWQIGKGALPSGGSLDRTALVDPLNYIDIYEVKNDGPHALVLGQFTNQEIFTSFSFEEIGLFAQDPDEGEILMCYGNAFGAGEVIQSATEQLREFVFGTQLTFSGDANVTCEIARGLVFIPMAEKGQPDGVTPLGPDGLVPERYLPELNKLDAVIQATYNGEVG